MEKLSMCRICLVENVSMFRVVNKSLQELYEKLTDVPFVTEDGRPMLACFFCCARLKQCARFQKKCLKAVGLFARMLDEDHEPNPLNYHLKLCGCLRRISKVLISIKDECRKESADNKKGVPAVEQGDIIDLGSEEASQNDVAIRPHHYEPVEKLLHHSELSMCRICMVKNIAMHELVNKTLQELYEKLTDIPFASEDGKPMLACFFCYASIKQCAQFQRKCVQAEELFVRMLDEVHEPNPLNNQVVHIKACGGLKYTPIEHVGIHDRCLSTFIHYESDEPLITIPIEVEEDQDKLMKEKETRQLKSVPVVKIARLDLQGQMQLGDTKTDKHNENTPSNSEIIQNENCISKVVTKFKEPSKNTCEKRFKCDICQRSFNTKSFLRKHISIHFTIYKCDTCQRSFSRKSLLKVHIRIHTGEKPFKCHTCQRSFRQKCQLKAHIRTHTGEKPFKCEICQRSFGQNYHLNRHIQIHTTEKPYKCDICQNSFKRKYDLNTHIRIHTGEKPFKCKICQLSFSRSTNLAKHRVIHSSEKPYKCKICPQRFKRKHDLKKHIRIHTDKKPFKCDICQSSFNRINNLDQHIRIHYKGKL